MNIIQNQDGSLYKGDVRMTGSGLPFPHGRGRMIYKYKGTYEGEFKYGKRDGRGIHSEDSSLHIGNLRNDVIQGPGIRIMQDQYKCEGEWKDGKPQGTMKLSTFNGTYVGQVFLTEDNDVVRQCLGNMEYNRRSLETLTHPNGSRVEIKSYRGWCFNNKRHGQAEWTTDSGTHTGTFENDSISYETTIVYDNGANYASQQGQKKRKR